jgi:conjugal transfer/entry exclusion protein
LLNAKTFSFIGGMVVVGTAVATLIAFSPKIRNELEHQVSQILDTTRDVIKQGQRVAQQMQSIGGALEAARGDSVSDAEVPQLLSPKRQAYETQWAQFIQSR